MEDMYLGLLILLFDITVIVIDVLGNKTLLNVTML